MNVLVPRLGTKLLCGFLFLSCFPTLVRSQANTFSEIGGEWRGGVIVGVQTDDRQPGCSTFSYLERIVLINPVPGNQALVRGLWRRHYISVWFDNPNGSCRWPSASSQAGSYESNLIFAIDGAFDPLTQTLHFKTLYKSCFGNACDQVATPEARKTLDQSLQIRGESLVDTSAEGQQSVLLLRTADAVELEASAKRAAVNYEKLFDEDRSEELIHNDLSSFGASAGTQMPEELRRFRTAVGRLVLRVPVSQLYACIWGSQPVKAAKLVLLIQRVQIADNRQGLEFMVLRQEEDVWKIDFLDFR